MISYIFCCSIRYKFNTMKLFICIGLVLCLLQLSVSQMTCMQGHTITGGAATIAVHAFFNDLSILQEFGFSICNSNASQTQCQRFDITGSVAGVNCEYR